MAKKQTNLQNEIQDTSGREGESLTDKIELQMTSLPLDQRVVSGRNIPIDKIREGAKINVSSYSQEPDKYLVKIYRSNVMVNQGLVPRGEYSVEQVQDYFRQEILSGKYDNALTDVYMEQKAKRKG